MLTPVTPLARDSWTPSFAPTYDSSHAVGAGLYSTIDAAYERAWHRRKRETGADIGWYGLESYPPESPDEVLAENATLIDELQAWQDFRARSHGPATPSEREQLVGESCTCSLLTPSRATLRFRLSSGWKRQTWGPLFHRPQSRRQNTHPLAVYPRHARPPSPPGCTRKHHEPNPDN